MEILNDCHSVIYEVNLKINLQIEEDFLKWLKEHVVEMLNIEGFLEATISTPELIEENNSVKLITCSYKVSSREMLKNYFDNHSQKMREDGIKRFGSQFTAERRILLALTEFKKSIKIDSLK